MKRQPVEIAASVFAFSVATELLCIRMLRGSVTEWLGHPHRLLLFVSMVLVNLLNAATALYFSSRAVRAEVRLKLGEQRSVYLNHHLRQALSIVQTASFLTNDEQTVSLCREAVTRIAHVLVSAEAGLTDPSAVLFANGQPRERSSANDVGT